MEFEKIAEIIANTLSIDKDDITPDSTFKSLSVDSLDMVEIKLLMIQVLLILVHLR